MENVLVINEKKSTFTISHLYDVFTLVLNDENIYLITTEDNFNDYNGIKRTLAERDQIFDEYGEVNGIFFITISKNREKLKKMTSDLLNIKNRADIVIPIESIKVLKSKKCKYLVSLIVAYNNEEHEIYDWIEGFEKAFKMYKLISNFYEKFSIIDHIEVSIKIGINANFEGAHTGSTFLTFLSLTNHDNNIKIFRKYLLTDKIKNEMSDYLNGPISKGIKKAANSSKDDIELLNKIFNSDKDIYSMYEKILKVASQITYELSEINDESRKSINLKKLIM
jgi:hypothetical protein